MPLAQADQPKTNRVLCKEYYLNLTIGTLNFEILKKKPNPSSFVQKHLKIQENNLKKFVFCGNLSRYLMSPFLTAVNIRSLPSEKIF